MTQYYSEKIANEIQIYLDGKDIPYEFDNVSGLYNFPFMYINGVGKVEMMIEVRDHYYVMTAQAPFEVEIGNQEMANAMAYRIGMINRLMGFGSFEFDLRYGMVRYKGTVLSYTIPPHGYSLQKEIDASMRSARHFWKEYGEEIGRIVKGDGKKKDGDQQISDPEEMMKERVKELLPYREQSGSEMKSRLSTILGV